MRLIKNLARWGEKHLALYTAIVTLILSPLIIWGEWDIIESAESTVVKIIIIVGTIVVEYLVALYIFAANRRSQRRYKERGIIE